MKRREHSENLGVDGKKIFQWILGKYVRKVWIGLIWLRIRTNGGSCEQGNEPSGFMKGGEFLDFLSDY
jgi:hypothetical protein